jgi:uncharacterized protein YjbI with pentapeptide repeats
MALPDDNLPDPASDDEWTSSRIFRLPPGDRSLMGTRHEGGDFMFAELAGVDLTEGDFYWAMFHNAILGGAILARCDLRGARFNEANLRHADLTGANCGLDNLGGSTDFNNADLSGTDLRQANLGGADFTGALLIGADLSGARFNCVLPGRVTRFQRANLTDARLGRTQFAGALYDSNTIFPHGFKPDAAGMAHSVRKSSSTHKPRKKWRGRDTI